MKRVLLVQPSLQPPGGGNGLAAWALQALVPGHRVTVLSWQPVEIEPINRFFGTHLRSSDFDTIGVPRWWRTIGDHLPTPSALIKLAFLMRYTRRVSSAYDVVFGLYNETDFGRRGIQYVNYPTYLRPRPGVDLRWYHPPRAVLNLYYAFADRLADLSVDRLKANVTLVNSDWAGLQVEKSLGIKTRTLYPPVIDPAPGLPWDERRNGFLAVGRISPEKEYERIIRILARVRSSAPDITLTIVGTVDRHTRRYSRSVTSLAQSLGSWIDIRDNLSRDEVRALMASHRYGIHGMREEHFGMAPAEMARAGAIVWVPRGGGQMEIVGREPALMYESEDDAVNKIAATIGNPGEQQRLRDKLAAVSEQFTAARFVEQVRAIVNEFEE
ncbi:MAG: glycosyltransferase family 4 protein [Cyanobacteria bacterium]|nr:glycosyltransferase family 4 protein [Cyanobacteriota bacterium]